MGVSDWPRAKAKETDLHKDIPVPVVVKSVRIQDLVLCHISVPMDVLCHELFVRILALGVLVQKFHVGMGRCRVQIVIELLDVFAVVPLMTCDAKKTFLQYAILAVP